MSLSLRGKPPRLSGTIEIVNHYLRKPADPEAVCKILPPNRL